MDVRFAGQSWHRSRRVVVAGALAVGLLAAGRPAMGQDGQPWTTSGASIYTTNAGSVGIGTTSPGANLHVEDTLGGVAPTAANAYTSAGLRLESSGGSSCPGETLFGQNAGANYFWWQVGKIDRGCVSNTGNLLADYSLAINPLGGNVGIGTTAPTAKLHVAGNVTVDGNISSRYQDVAEWVRTRDVLAPGTVVVIGATEAGIVEASQQSYDTAVAGVVSPQPGIILGEPAADKVLVAHSGRVRVKVDASYGAVRAGDLLVTSPTPGLAMRSEPVAVGGAALHRPGTLLGKALEPLARGQGEILVLLTLQ